MPPRESRGASGFGRAVYNAILEEIAARLQRLGVVGGTHIDADHIVGALPPGVGRITVQHDGTDVAYTGVLNFVGAGFVVTADAVLDRVNVALAHGTSAPDAVVERSTGAFVVGRTGGEDVVTRLA